MHLLRRLCFTAAAAAALTLAMHGVANAQTTVVSVTGNTGSFYYLNGPGSQGVYTAWSETNAYTDASISAVLANLTSSGIDGTAYLTTAVGPAATSSDLVASAPFTIAANTGYGGVDTTLFTGLPELDANTTYYLVLNTDSPQSLDAGWEIGSSTVTDTGVTNYAGNGSSSAATPTYQSDFNTDNISGSPAYTVTGDLVPESASLALIAPSALVLAGLSLFARRRKAMQS